MGEVLHVGIDDVDAVSEDKRVGPLPGCEPGLDDLVAIVSVEGVLQPLAAGRQVAGRLHADETDAGVAGFLQRGLKLDH